MNWNKLKIQHYKKEPVDYIYSSTIFDAKEHDKLYENQMDLNHQVWKEFHKTYKTDFKFFDDLKEIIIKPVICLWFFRDRNDKDRGIDLQLKDKIIKYSYNTFFITKYQDIKINERETFFPRRPVLQLDMPVETFDTIVSRFQ